MNIPNFSERDGLCRKLISFFCMMAVIFCAGTGNLAYAQNGTVKVKGTVSCNGEAVIGASVIENGTTNGTVTDFDGNYTITVNANAQLTVSAIGYIVKDDIDKAMSNYNS